jgi:hypothetical protein
MKLPKIPYAELIYIPVFLILLGAASNQVVLIANHDKFPVMVNAKKLEMFTARPCAPDSDDMSLKYRGLFWRSQITVKQVACVTHKDLGSEGMIDDVHCVMSRSNHLKGLSDIFDLKDAIYSVGDGLLMLGEELLSFTSIMWLALVLRKLIGGQS